MRIYDTLHSVGVVSTSSLDYECKQKIRSQVLTVTLNLKLILRVKPQPNPDSGPHPNIECCNGNTHLLHFVFSLTVGDLCTL